MWPEIKLAVVRDCRMNIGIFQNRFMWLIAIAHRKTVTAGYTTRL